MSSNTRSSTSSNTTGNIVDPLREVLVSAENVDLNVIEWISLTNVEISALADNELIFDIDYYSISGKIQALLDNQIVLDLVGSSSMATIYKK